MMHIFSHICFWFASIFLYVVLYPVDFFLGIFFTVAGLALLISIYFFLRGYRKGMAVTRWEATAREAAKQARRAREFVHVFA